MIDIKNMPSVKFNGFHDIESSKENKFFDEYMNSGRKPLQWIADKFSKNKAWKITKAKWDLEKKSLKISKLVNTDDIEDVDVSYEDICKEMKWKSFKILDKNTAISVEMTMDEIDKQFIEALKKTRIKDAKWLKEHPELDPEKQDENKKNN